MKTLVFILVLGLTTAQAATADAQTKFSVNADNISVEELIQLVEQKSDYVFFYKDDIASYAQNISVNLNNATIDEVLSQALKSTGLTYHIDGRQVTIKSDLSNTDFSDLNAAWQLRGVVLDDIEEKPLPGATVRVEGSSIGAVTGPEGLFVLEVDEGDVVIVSFIGYATERFTVAQGMAQRTIRLTPLDNQFEDVVVVGYGTQARNEISSAIETTKGEVLVENLGSNLSLDQGLVGLMKGVQVIQANGRPGELAEINIRGLTSPFLEGNNNPLWVIDGVPLFTEPLNATSDEYELVSQPNPMLSINPEEIQSVEVLKDAAATAIYGSRGANGVILVTTKQGKSGKAQITFDTSFTTSSALQQTEYMTTDELKQYVDGVMRNSVDAYNNGESLSRFWITQFGQNYGEVDYDFATRQMSWGGIDNSQFGDGSTTDWQAVLLQDNPVFNRNNLSIRGGSDNSSYSVSGGYTSQEGMIINNKLKQYNLRLAGNTKFKNFLDLGTSFNLGHTLSKTGEGSFNNTSFLGYELSEESPFWKAFDENGDPMPIDRGDETRPNFYQKMTGADYQKKDWSMIGNIYATARITDALSLRASTNVRNSTADVNRFKSKENFEDRNKATGEYDNPSVRFLGNNNFTKVVTNIKGDYALEHGKNAANFTLGYEWDRSNNSARSFTVEGFPDDQVLTNPSSAVEATNYAGIGSENGLNSLFSRLTYSYDDKYFFTGNLRRDVSPSFAPGSQDAIFPSLGATWNITKEEFFQNQDKIDELRLRASWGKTGSTNVPPFSFRQFFVGDNSYANNPSTIFSGAVPNDQLRWETTKEYNVGVDLSAFNNRLQFGMDIYDRKTTDALMRGYFPLEIGGEEFITNFADVSNKGIEFDISGRIVQKKDFTWDASFNFGKNKDKLIRFNEELNNTSAIVHYREGESLNLILGYKVKKIFETQAEVDQVNAEAQANGHDYYLTANTGVGDYWYEDLDGDGVISSSGDRDIIGKNSPDFFGGFNTTLRYKNLRLNTNFNYSVGAQATNAQVISSGIGFFASPLFGVRNYPKALMEENRWSANNTGAALPRMVVGDSGANALTNSWTVYDRSFLRLKALNLEYDLPSSFMNKAGFQGMSVGLIGTNLLTFTKFPYTDPESRRAGLAEGFSVSHNDAYPGSKSFGVGAKIRF